MTSPLAAGCWLSESLPNVERRTVNAGDPPGGAGRPDTLRPSPQGHRRANYADRRRTEGAPLAGLGVVDRALDFDLLPMHEIFSDHPAEKLPALLGGADRLVSCFAAGNKQAEQALMRVSGAVEAHFLPVRPPADFPGHLSDLSAQELDIAPLNRMPNPWPLPAEWRQEARQVLRKVTRQASTGNFARSDYVVMHPGAGSPQKRWPIANFPALANQLERRWGLPTVFVIGSAEQEQFSLSDITMLDNAFPVLTSPPLHILSALLADAKAYVGNDSGPSHLAAALGVPTAVIFGLGETAHFAPLGRAVNIISSKTMNCVSLEEVEGALEQLFSRRMNRLSV